MNIKFVTAISLVYMVAEKWILIEAADDDASPSTNVREFSLEERKAAVNQFQRYFPILDQYWDVFGEHKEVMKSAMGCVKLAVVVPFLNTWRLILLAVGYGMDAEKIKSFMMRDGTSREAPPNEFYQQISEFNELAKSVGERPEETNIYQVVERTDVTLKDIFSTVMSGANQISKFTVNEMGSSIKSCFDTIVQIARNKKLQQNFIDAIRNIAKGTSDWSGSLNEPRRSSLSDDTRGSESSSGGGFFGFFGKKDDPFKDCVKTDLRDINEEGEDNY